jgi:probable non-F420 flavinoid oxidoreductase
VTVIGFHASHEQVHPSALLAAAQAAEQAGFTAAMCSDHYFPWSERQGQSAFSFAWLGAALQATSLPFGMVTAPGQRYHPAIAAQAMATLAAMYPGRFWAALGSGQNLNEHITGDVWPRKEVRQARLRECVDVMRLLFTGETVSHDGLVTVDRARLFTLPEPADQPALLAAAVTPRTARWAAQWADGLITVNQPLDVLRAVVGEYRDAGGRGPLALQVHLSYAADEETAFAVAVDQWLSNLAPPPVTWDLATHEEFDKLAVLYPPERVRENVRISADPAQHAAWIAEYADLGFDRIFLHHVGKEQLEWIDVFGERVLPQLDVTTPSPVGTYRSIGTAP